MRMQFKIVNKKEAHDIIDSMPGEKVMILTFNKSLGISDNGRFVKKCKSKKMADKASFIVLSKANLTATLDLHTFADFQKENIVKSILLQTQFINCTNWQEKGTK